MACKGQGVHAKVLNVYGHVEPPLNGVRVEARAMRVGNRRELAHGLDNTRLVVGEHDGDERDVIAHEGIERLGLNIARRTGVELVDGKTRCM